LDRTTDMKRYRDRSPLAMDWLEPSPGCAVRGGGGWGWLSDGEGLSYLNMSYFFGKGNGQGQR
jgi:hypothetical protein